MKLQDLLKQWLGADANTSATIIISFIIFFLGVLFTEAAKMISKAYARKRTRKVCKIAFEKLEYGIRKQAEAFKRYSDSLDFDNKKGFTYSTVVLPAINVFNELGYQNLYDAFLGGARFHCSKLKLKAFQGFWTGVVALPQWQSDFKPFPKEHVDQFNRWNEIRNNSLGEFMKGYEPFILKHHNQQLPTDIASTLMSFDQIMVEYQKMPDMTHPQIAEDYLVQPMLSNIRKARDFPYVLLFSQPLLKASIAFKNMEKGLLLNKQMAFSFYLIFRGYSRLLKVYKKILF